MITAAAGDGAVADRHLAVDQLRHAVVESIGEGSANPGGIPARYVLKAMIPIGFALFFLQSLAQGIRGYLRLAESA